MTIKQEKWDDAKTLFELGKPLSYIERETGISKGAISKKSKKGAWFKGKGKQLVLDDARVTVEKATKSKRELELHNEEVNKLTKNELMIRELTNDNMIGVRHKLRNHEALTMLDHKAAQDLIDKASLTLGVNERHSKPTQVSQSTQTAVTEGMGLVGLLAEAKRLKAEKVNH